MEDQLLTHALASSGGLGTGILIFLVIERVKKMLSGGAENLDVRLAKMEQALGTMADRMEDMTGEIKTLREAGEKRALNNQKDHSKMMEEIAEMRGAAAAGAG